MIDGVRRLTNAGLSALVQAEVDEVLAAVVEEDLYRLLQPRHGLGPRLLPGEAEAAAAQVGQRLHLGGRGDGGQGGGGPGGGAHRVQALAPTHDLYITCNTIGCKGGSLVPMFGPRPLALDGLFTCGHLCKC